jgi:hypothetical protein
MLESISTRWVEAGRAAFQTRLHRKSASAGEMVVEVADMWKKVRRAVFETRLHRGAAFETRLYAIRVAM